MPKVNKQQLNKEIQIQNECNQLLSKWQNEYLKNPELFIYEAKKLQLKLIQPRVLKIEKNTCCFFMMCVKCKKNQPLLPSHYNKQDIKHNFLFIKSGYEQFRNRLTYPCRTCNTENLRIRDSTLNGRISNRMKEYKLLFSSYPCEFGKNGEGWFWEQWTKQNGEYFINNRNQLIILKQANCNICKHEMYIDCDDFDTSINNINVANKGSKNHKSDECELICAEHNVAQQHNDIKDLKQAWKIIFDLSENQNFEDDLKFVDHAKQNWDNKNNKSKNGVLSNLNSKEYDMQRRNLDLYTICNEMSMNHKKHDILKERDNNLTAKDIYELLILQPRCYYSGGLLTIKNGPMRFSVERLNNSIGHVKGNCVLISRMLNSQAQMSKRKFIKMRESYRNSEYTSV